MKKFVLTLVTTTLLIGSLSAGQISNRNNNWQKCYDREVEELDANYDGVMWESESNEDAFYDCLYEAVTVYCNKQTTFAKKILLIKVETCYEQNVSK